jgi:hypothetical protein
MGGGWKAMHPELLPESEMMVNQCFSGRFRVTEGLMWRPPAKNSCKKNPALNMQR